MYTLVRPSVFDFCPVGTLRTSFFDMSINFFFFLTQTEKTTEIWPNFYHFFFIYVVRFLESRFSYAIYRCTSIKFLSLYCLPNFPSTPVIHTWCEVCTPFFLFTVLVLRNWIRVFYKRCFVKKQNNCIGNLLKGGNICFNAVPIRMR